MKIYVILMTQSDKIIDVDLTETDAVLDVKKKIHAKEGIPPETQTLIYTGNILQDDCMLKEKNIQRHSKIHLAVTLKCKLHYVV